MKSPVPLPRDRHVPSGITQQSLIHNRFNVRLPLHANINPPKAREKTIKIPFVRQIISLVTVFDWLQSKMKHLAHVFATSNYLQS